MTGYAAAVFFGAAALALRRAGACLRFARRAPADFDLRAADFLAILLSFNR
jgi:hypothetical protein